MINERGPGQNAREDDEGQAQCHCEPGYLDVGLTCVADCLSVGCSDRGGCVVMDDEPRCVCDQGYQPVGLECRPDACRLEDCGGHDEGGALACVCDPGYGAVGMICRPRCSATECPEHSVCIQDGNGVHCLCDPGYVSPGFDCEPVGTQAANPVPAEGATEVEPDQPLGWEAAFGADSYDLYLGMDRAAVLAATNSTPEFLGNSTNRNCWPAN